MVWVAIKMDGFLLDLEEVFKYPLVYVCVLLYSESGAGGGSTLL